MARTRKPDPKLAALAASGALNTHAQAVQDPAFVDSNFFDARDLVQVRYEMLRRVRLDGQAVAEAASSFGPRLVGSNPTRPARAKSAWAL